GGFLRDATDPAMADDPGVRNYCAFLEKYYPCRCYFRRQRPRVCNGPSAGAGLEQAGENLTRENIMRQAANSMDLEIDMLMPGIKVNTSPHDSGPAKSIQLRRLVSERGQPF